MNTFWFTLVSLKNLHIRSIFIKKIFYLGGRCEEGQECDSILDGFENIDDELDETGIVFVTTEDASIAREYGLKTFPSLVFFRNKEPLVYTGDLEDEDEVLTWLIDEDTLKVPGRIEEVNTKMLEKILNENKFVVVFFCKYFRRFKLFKLFIVFLYINNI